MSSLTSRTTRQPPRPPRAIRHALATRHPLLLTFLSLALPAASSACTPDTDPAVPSETASPESAAAALIASKPVELKAGGLLPQDAYGSAVALSGNTAIVAASWADRKMGDGAGALKVEDAGAAYVFERKGSWQESFKLSLQEPAPWTYFGASVALAGDTALVGAPGTLSKAGVTGAVHVFLRTGDSWEKALSPPLVAPDSTDLDSFGSSVALSDTTAFVGAYRHDKEAGAVYVFSRMDTGWQFEQKLLPDSARGGAGFGLCLALSGATLVVGAPGDTDGGVRTGAAYVFVQDGGTWVKQARLTPSPRADKINFGRSVAIFEDTVLIGATGADVFGPDAGAAYLSRRSDGVWSHPEPIGVSDPAGGDQLGNSVALDGDLMAVGAWREDDGENKDTGAVYVFEQIGGSWTEAAKITLDNPAAYDNFGFRVAVEEQVGSRTVLATAAFSNTWATHAGTAYVFEMLLENGRECQKEGECHSGHCVDGVCCDDVCSLPGLSCTTGTCQETPESSGAGGEGGSGAGSGGGGGGAGGGASDTGMPLPPLASGPVEERSYYSCQTSPGGANSGALAAAGVLAGLALRSRRKRTS